MNKFNFDFQVVMRRILYVLYPQRPLNPWKILKDSSNTTTTIKNRWWKDLPKWVRNSKYAHTLYTKNQIYIYFQNNNDSVGNIRIMRRNINPLRIMKRPSFEVIRIVKKDPLVGTLRIMKWSNDHNAVRIM